MTAAELSVLGSAVIDACPGEDATTAWEEVGTNIQCGRGMSGSRRDKELADHATQNTSKVKSCAGKPSSTTDLAHEYVSYASILVGSWQNQTVLVRAATGHLRSCEYTRLYFRRPWLKFSAWCLDQKRLLVGHFNLIRVDYNSFEQVP